MYVIIGAGGFLGSYLMKAITNNTKEHILAVDKNISDKQNKKRVEWFICDITNDLDLNNLNTKLKEYDTVNIVYLAAYHHPDKVKENPKLAWNINITSLSKFVNSIENVNSFFYSSTEMVYGAGDLNSYFKEDAKLKPVNLYGQHKVVAESITLGYGYNVVRFPFLIGTCLIPHQKHFYDVIVDTIKEGKPIEMFKDSFKTALDFDTAANTLISIIENYREDMPKVLNISGDEVLSKYEIGLRIAQKYNCSEKLIVPISLSEDNKIFSEKRADCTLLDNTLVKEALNIKELKIKL